MEVKEIKTVVENLNDFIEVPNGISRLRSAVLDLAVRGLLTEQKSVDGTAEDLYNEIQKVKEKITKKKTKPNVIENKEIPFDIPASWKWMKTREFTVDCGQKTPDRDFLYIDVNSIDSKKGIIVSPKKTSSEKAPSRARKLVGEKTLIYSTVRPYLLNTAVLSNSDFEKEVIVSTAFIVLHPIGNLISSDYLHLVVRSDFFNLKVGEYSKGISYPAINDANFGKLVFPIPPLAEQKRIVERVDELMKLIDQLEVEKKERDEVRNKMAVSAFYSFGTEHNEFALEHLSVLVKTRSDIDALEKSISSLAVRALLTEQKINEKVSVTDEILEGDFVIPENWSWMKWKSVLGDDKYSMKRGPFGSSLKKEFFVPEGIKVYEQRNAIHNVDGERYFINEEKYEELKAFTVRPGDFIISCSGTLGRIAELTKDSKIGIINQALLKVRLNNDLILNNYFKILFESDYIQNRIYAEALGIAMTNMVGVKVLKEVLMPIPPIAEQKRIVAKVNELKEMVQKLREVIEK